MREYIKTKRIIPHHVAEELEKMVIDYAYKNGMTIANIRDCVNHVEEYMKKNAILEKEADPEEAIGKDFLSITIKDAKDGGECRAESENTYITEYIPKVEKLANETRNYFSDIWMEWEGIVKDPSCSGTIVEKWELFKRGVSERYIRDKGI